MEWKQTSYSAWENNNGWFYQIFRQYSGWDCRGIDSETPSGPFRTEQAAMQHLDDTIEDRRKA